MIDQKKINDAIDHLDRSGKRDLANEVRVLMVQSRAPAARRSHDSDCAVHNEPAYPNGDCDCSLARQSQVSDEIKELISSVTDYLAALDGWENTNKAEKRVSRAETLMRSALSALQSPPSSIEKDGK